MKGHGMMGEGQGNCMGNVDGQDQPAGSPDDESGEAPANP